MKRKPAICAVFLCAFALSAEARITRIEIDPLRSQSPTFDGLSFGKVGQYEKIFARASGEVDPSDRRNALIPTTTFPPPTARGLVGYPATSHSPNPTNSP